MLNMVSLHGRLTADPELRITKTDKPVVTFTLAVDRDFGDKETDFVTCVAWNKTAEFLHTHFVKGSQAVVCGRLQSRKWEDKDGSKRVAWEVVAERVYFAGDKKSPSAPSPAFSPHDDEEDGALPF